MLFGASSSSMLSGSASNQILPPGIRRHRSSHILDKTHRRRKEGQQALLCRGEQQRVTPHKVSWIYPQCLVPDVHELYTPEPVHEVHASARKTVELFMIL